MTLALIPFLLTALAVSPNLLENSGFELPDASGWKIAADGAVDHGLAHSGKASLRLTVPGSAAISWYQATQRVLPVKRGATYTISAYVRTKSVSDGVGAYVSVAFFDRAGKRLGYADSPVKVKGTSNWRPLTATGHIPDGTLEMHAVLVIHGHGTAWFDDVQLEEGPTPTPYQPSLADVAEHARRAAEAQAAAAWLGALPQRLPGQARIAILDETFPAGDCQPSDPAVLAKALTAAGYACVRITAQQLANPVYLDPTAFELLMIPSGDAFPADADHALVAYLQHGGVLLTTGGYALDRPLIRFQGKWCLSESLPVGNAPATAAFPTGSGAWQKGSNRPQSAEIRSASGPNQSAALELHTAAISGSRRLRPAWRGGCRRAGRSPRFGRGVTSVPRGWRSNGGSPMARGGRTSCRFPHIGDNTRCFPAISLTGATTPAWVAAGRVITSARRTRGGCSLAFPPTAPPGTSRTACGWPTCACGPTRPGTCASLRRTSTPVGPASATPCFPSRSKSARSIPRFRCVT
jgi:hypothetical protein